MRVIVADDDVLPRGGLANLFDRVGTLRQTLNGIDDIALSAAWAAFER